MRKTILFLLMLCGTSLMLCAQERSDSDAASKIVALENVWSRAWGNNEIKVLTDLLDERFLCVDLNGRLRNKAEALEDVQDSQIHQVLMSSIDVRLHGDTAVVTGLFQIMAVEHGKFAQRKGRFIDTWLRRDGKWLAIGRLTTPVT